MASFPREQLEDWVQRWLQVNRDAEKAGDWATYGTDIQRLGQIIGQLTQSSGKTTK